MVVTCEIQFEENPNGTFFAGQAVYGKVVLTADKPKDVKGIQLKITGRAETHWRQKSRRDRRNFYGREDYITSTTFLLGSEENQRVTLQAGTHAFTFASQLPYNCPSSFEGRHGSIRYVIKVVLIRPWKFDQTYTRGMTVLKMVDLNFDTPQLRLPSNTETYKTFCCGPCKTDPLKLELYLPQTGFVPGQNITARALVINNTNIPVAEVNFELVMLVRYYSQYPRQGTEVERIVVNKVKSDSVLRNCTRSLIEEIPVPATPPTCMNACTLIQIAYHVQVEAKMKGMHTSQTITMPVIVGTVPLWDAVIQQQPRSSRQIEEQLNSVGADNQQSMDTSVDEKAARSVEISESFSMSEVPATNYAAALPNKVYPDLPPPSYEESVHTERVNINADELHAFGACEFAPLYPVYSFSTPNGTSNGRSTAAAADVGGHENPGFQ